MKTINEAAQNSFDRIVIYAADTNEEDYKGGFKIGVEFAQRWIPVEEKLPEQIMITTCSENNGNIHFHGIKYLLKGYYNEKKDLIGFETGEYVPGKVYYYFLRPSNFTVTHWRPIELK